MNKFIKLILILSFFVPILSWATVEYVPLEALPGISQQNGNTNSPVAFKNFVPNLFNLFIAIAAVAAVVQIIIGGFLYLSSDAILKKSEGKGKIENALIGLLLALSAFIILNTINPNTLNFNLELRTYTPPTINDGPGGEEIQCAVNPCGMENICGDPTKFECKVIKDPVNPNSCTKDCVPKGQKVACLGDNCISQYPMNSPWPSDSSIRSDLVATGMISIKGTQKNTPCTTVGEAGCTSVYDLHVNAINGLKSLVSSCKCSITITGGTEFWPHDSHGPGHGRVDIDDSNPKLNEFIKKQTPITTTQCHKNQSYPKYKINNDIYVLEGNHWHVCYNGIFTQQ